jgi:hypothetical protein
MMSLMRYMMVSSVHSNRAVLACGAPERNFSSEREIADRMKMTAPVWWQTTQKVCSARIPATALCMDPRGPRRASLGPYIAANVAVHSDIRFSARASAAPAAKKAVYKRCDSASVPLVNPTVFKSSLNSTLLMVRAPKQNPASRAD